MSSSENNQELRATPRLNRKANVFVELKSFDTTGTPYSYVLDCESIDISKNGMQLYINGNLETDKVLQLCVRIKGYEQVFTLMAEVRWCREMVDEGWNFVGLLLYDADDSSIAEWQKWVEETQNPATPDDE